VGWLMGDRAMAGMEGVVGVVGLSEREAHCCGDGVMRVEIIGDT
jgi:hypothetical protein